MRNMRLIPGVQSSFLERDFITTFEGKDFSGFVWCCDLFAQALDDLAREGHLLGVGFGEFAAPRPKTVLEPDTDVRAHGGGLRGNAQLAGAGAEHGPAIAVAEETVGRPLHMSDVFGMRADAAEQAEHRLNEERRLDQLAIGEMREIVKMGNVVAFKLED